MLCGNCKKNQATKTYEQIKKGKTDLSYYCLDCYHKLFVCSDGTDGEPLAACPYCGTTVADFKKRNLVGCAHCYQTLFSAVLPVVTKLQGGQAHKGKAAYTTESERLEKRKYELETVVAKLQSEENYADAEKYERRLAQMEEGLEEEYVWQKRPRLLKRL